ncbi:MAG: YbhN family protein [Hyphomicrobiales bacterium]
MTRKDGLQEESEKVRRAASGTGLSMLRVAGTIVLIAALFYFFDARAILQRLAAIDILDACLALLVLCIQYLAGAARWHYILLRHDIRLPLLNSLAIFGSASFAQSIMSHTVVPLSVKGVMLKGQGAGTSRMLGVLLVERLAAASGLAVCFLVSITLAFAQFREMVVGVSVTTMVVIAAVALLMAAGGLLTLRVSRVRNFAREIRGSFFALPVVASLVLMSTAIVYMGFYSVALLAWGMHLNVGALDLLIVLPLVAFAAALPVSLGGWGVREGMMVATLSLFGVPAEAALALSITYGLLGTASSMLLGAVCALLFQRRERRDHK